jgi:hypothetical protein
MLPTSALPMSPFLNATSMGALIVLIALVGLVALVAGYVLHGRGEPLDPTIEVLDEAAAAGAPETPRRQVNG